MTALPVEVLYGISFGFLVGIVPVVFIGMGRFLFEYYRSVSIPAMFVVAFALVTAGANGYVLGVFEPDPAQISRLFVASLVVLMLALYTNSQGAALAVELSRKISRPSPRTRSLAVEAIESVDGTGHVGIEPTGSIRDLDGYPPLSPELREELANSLWRLPADLPLSALEVRLKNRLLTDYNLAAVSVSIDPQGRAMIEAAPPSRAIARRLSDEYRAVSIEAMIPTGLSPGEDVLLEPCSKSVSGTVLSIELFDRTDSHQIRERSPEKSTDLDCDISTKTESRSQKRQCGMPSKTRTAGGVGRVTVGIPTVDAGHLIDTDRCQVAVPSGETSHTFEALSLLERSGTVIRKLIVTPENKDLLPAGENPGALLAVRHGPDTDTDQRHGWSFDPTEAILELGDEVFVVGTETELNRYDRRNEPNSALVSR